MTDHIPPPGEGDPDARLRTLKHARAQAETTGEDVKDFDAEIEDVRNEAGRGPKQDDEARAELENAAEERKLAAAAERAKAAAASTSTEETAKRTPPQGRSTSPPKATTADKPKDK